MAVAAQVPLGSASTCNWSGGTEIPPSRRAWAQCEFLLVVILRDVTTPFKTWCSPCKAISQGPAEKRNQRSYEEL